MYRLDHHDREQIHNLIIHKNKDPQNHHHQIQGHIKVSLFQKDRVIKQIVARQIKPNGVIPTPKVPMGAGLSKIFNGCPLNINCATSWIHPETNDQHILFGCDEGMCSILYGP